MADLDALRDRCEALADDLADAALDLIREALHATDPAAAKVLERRVTRARRSVEKAAHLLAGADAGLADDG